MGGTETRSENLLTHDAYEPTTTHFVGVMKANYCRQLQLLKY